MHKQPNKKKKLYMSYSKVCMRCDQEAKLLFIFISQFLEYLWQPEPNNASPKEEK